VHRALTRRTTGMPITLQLILVASVGAPLIVAARRAPNAWTRAFWCVVLLLVAAVGALVDPLAAGLLRVDDVIVGRLCGVGAR
jgi:hypothetical protein